MENFSAPVARFAACPVSYYYPTSVPPKGIAPPRAESRLGYCKLYSSEWRTANAVFNGRS
jgi:hypothetical protein